MTKQLLSVEGTKVAVVSQGGENYISLTDKVRDSENGSSVIENWLRNKNTLEFLSAWEEIYNPAFNSLEFEGIKNEAGLNRFAISVKQWIAKTAAIGVIAKAGRYGGTYVPSWLKMPIIQADHPHAAASRPMPYAFLDQAGHPGKARIRYFPSHAEES